MAQSSNKNWIHAIWTTKYREPLILAHEDHIYKIIAEQLEKMGSLVIIVNGMPDHVHCLFRLSKLHSMAKVIQQAKGASSFYINKLRLCNRQFAWQKGYACYAVSRWDLQKITSYINNQKMHHAKKSLDDELRDLQ